MKALKNRSYIVAILVIIFIGIAGGFTNSEYGRWVNNQQCSVSNPDDPLNIIKTLEQQRLRCDAVNGVWLGEEKHWQRVPISNSDAKKLRYEERIVFDPKSTALFVIAGVIIILVGLEMRKKK